MWSLQIAYIPAVGSSSPTSTPSMSMSASCDCGLKSCDTASANTSRYAGFAMKLPAFRDTGRPLTTIAARLPVDAHPRPRPVRLRQPPLPQVRRLDDVPHRIDDLKLTLHASSAVKCRMRCVRSS